MYQSKECRLQAGFNIDNGTVRLNAVLPAFLLCFAMITDAAQKPLAGYDIVTVETVTVDKSVEKFPAGYDTQIQEKIVDELRKKKVFPEVINALLEMNAPTPAKPLKKAILRTRIIEYKPGNRALRYTIGWGSGATRIRAKFTFHDAETGNELFSTTQQGKFLGFVNIYGPGRNHSASESSGDLVDALIREIRKQR